MVQSPSGSFNVFCQPMQPDTNIGIPLVSHTCNHRSYYQHAACLSGFIMACKCLQAKNEEQQILADGKLSRFVEVDSFSVIRCPVDLMLTLIAEHAEASTREERGVVYRYCWIKSGGMFR